MKAVTMAPAHIATMETLAILESRNLDGAKVESAVSHSMW
jgi:hypothetical protein